MEIAAVCVVNGELDITHGDAERAVAASVTADLSADMKAALSVVSGCDAAC